MLTRKLPKGEWLCPLGRLLYEFTEGDCVTIETRPGEFFVVNRVNIKGKVHLRWKVSEGGEFKWETTSSYWHPFDWQKTKEITGVTKMRTNAFISEYWMRYIISRPYLIVQADDAKQRQLLQYCKDAQVQTIREIEALEAKLLKLKQEERQITEKIKTDASTTRNASNPVRTTRDSLRRKVESYRQRSEGINGTSAGQVPVDAVEPGHASSEVPNEPVGVAADTGGAGKS